MTSSQPSVPLSQPYYGASIGAAFRRFWSKYATLLGPNPAGARFDKA